MDETEPETEQSGDEEFSDVASPSSPVGHDAQFPSDLLVQPKIPTKGTKRLHIILHSFFIMNLFDGFVRFFFPAAASVATNQYSIPTLTRSHGIFSLTIALCSTGFIQSLSGNAGFHKAFKIPIHFYCIATLGNLVYEVVSTAPSLCPYLWVSIGFYGFWIFGLARLQKADNYDGFLEMIGEQDIQDGTR